MSQRTWEFLLGLEPAPWEGPGRWRFQWMSLPTGDTALIALALLVAAGVGLWVLYRWEARRLPRIVRLVLSCFRVVVILAVAAMLCEPVIVLSKQEFVPSNLLVLVDRSQSMGLRDAWQNETRAAGVAKALGLEGGPEEVRRETRLKLAGRLLGGGLLEELAGGGDRTVHVHTFADRLDDTPAEGVDAGSLQVAGQTTALGSAVRQALLNYRGMPLAGVLVVSDGQSNAGEPAEAAARSAAEEGVSIVTVAAGTAEGPRNAAIFELEHDPVVFVRDTNRITVHIQSRGLAQTPAEVTLEERRDDGPWQEIGREEVILEAEGRLQAVSFDYSEPRPGKLEFRAKIAELPAELTVDDNVALGEVRVIRQKLRVLFIAGSTFPEVQFLRNTFLRDRGIELSSWLMAAAEDYEQPGDNPIRRLPATQEELDQFDCVVLYDPDPAKWPPQFPELLTDFTAKSGGGLIYIAGEMQTAKLFDRQDDPTMAWVRLLPVVREPGLFRSEVQMRLSARSAWRLQITPEGTRDPVFAFADDPDENERILQSLPGMYWHFPVTRAKPGATVLAVHGDPRMRNEFGPEVLLATQLVGPGRTFFVGFDSTYRWRYLDEQYFDGFWARLVDRAGRSKQLGGVYPFRLSTDRFAYEPGSQITVSARFSDPEAVDPGLRVLYGEVEHGDEAPVPIALERTSVDGEFQATFTAARAGPHFIRVWAGDEAVRSVVKAATMQVEVELPNLELENPGVDRARLEAVAEATGGRTFDLADADEIASAFQVRRVARVLEDRQEIWDAPLLWGLLFLGLLAEWLLRKAVRLI